MDGLAPDAFTMHLAALQTNDVEVWRGVVFSRCAEKAMRDCDREDLRRERLSQQGSQHRERLRFELLRERECSLAAWDWPTLEIDSGHPQCTKVKMLRLCRSIGDWYLRLYLCCPVKYLCCALRERASGDDVSKRRSDQAVHESASRSLVAALMSSGRSFRRTHQTRHSIASLKPGAPI